MLWLATVLNCANCEQQALEEDMSGGGEAVVTLGAFFGTLLLLVWLRALILGRNTAGWVTASNVQLNRRWGRPNSQGLRRMKAKARVDVLKSLGGCADPLVIELNEKLEILGDKAECVVPPISTVALAIMVVFEAIQYIAIPFASGVAWNRDSNWGILPKVLAYGIPQHDLSENFHALVWLVSLPTIVTVVFTGVLVLLFSLVTLTWYCGGLFAHGYGRLSDAATSLVRFCVWLLIITKELLCEFGLLYMLTGLLMITSCTLHDEHFTDAQCWKVPSQAVLNPVSVLQLVLYIFLLFWSDLPVHVIPSWIERMLATKLGIKINDMQEKNDYMLLRRELGSKELQLDVLPTTGGVQVFDFHRPMFSSWSSGVNGSAKLVLGFVYVFGGDQADWQWTILGISAACYFILLAQNICGSPCSFHWVNVSRSMGLLAGIGAVGCGLLAQGLGPTSDVPTMLFAAILSSYIIFGPIALYWAHRSQNSEGEMGGLMSMDIMQSYERLVILCQISQLVRQEVSLEKESGIQTDESLLSVFFDTRDTMIRDISRRLILRQGEWSSWSKQDNCLFRNIFGCCSWFVDHGPREEFSESHEPPPHQKPPSFTARGLRPNMRMNGKVERWMTTACLIIDPSEDVELGLNVPLDMYFSVVDGVPKYAVAGSDTLSSQSLAQELLDSGSSSSGAPAGVKGMGQPAREVLDGVKQGFNAQDGPCNPVKEVHVTPYENP